MRERQIVEEALAKSSHAEQQAYLAEACGGDAALRQQVEDLLRLQQQPGDMGAAPEVAAPAPEVRRKTKPLPTSPKAPSVRGSLSSSLPTRRAAWDGSAITRYCRCWARAASASC